ncbi:Chloroperoxidase [Mycena metata]|uniref:Chloroperoxidase n=1 Tax=Mycena metata TaxID=1033252 RepID=A0AAD7HV12_9AGAR|nr:Chloroperoxidase [Mycena metata]
MKLFTSISLLLLTGGSAALTVREVQDGQTGVLMVLPPRQTDTGSKPIPDPAHPYIAPGPNDQRGPCPAMNTLANHGYVSRNGITTFEEMILAGQEAFNMDQNLIAGMIVPNFLAHGNLFTNKISIGGISPFVPPLPGNIDGPATLGIAKHGRVEGDASLSRSDAFIGDNRNFNQTIWNTNLEEISQFAVDGPDGPNTVVNVQTFIEIKRQNIESDQALNPQFAMPLRRYNAVFAAPAVALGQVFFLVNPTAGVTNRNFDTSLFSNGTTNLLTKNILNSFFEHQTFPAHWFRASAPVVAATTGAFNAEIAAGLPQWFPGHNDENGVFVADPPAPAPFNTSIACGAYWDQIVNGTPGSLANATGILKQNVDLLNGILFAGSKCSQSVEPAGPTYV